MLTFAHAIILGIVEGITEFLPISSTGHMILASNAMRIPEYDFLKSFEIFIQLGAILAVLLMYWKNLLLNTKIFKRVAIAFVPTAIVGLLFYKFVKAYFLGNTHIVAWAFGIGGILLIIFELFRKKKQSIEVESIVELESITYKQALLIGFFQSIAIIPGVSRSAATIVGGLMMGISRRAIVEFSFMLAVPTLMSATLFDLAKSSYSFTSNEWGLLGVGFVTAFFSALVAVRFLVDFVKNHTFIIFGVYRIVIALVFLIFLL